MSPLLLIILHPFRAAEKLRQAPRWLLAFAVVAAGFILLRVAWQSHIVETTVAALPATASGADRQWAGALLDSELLLRCAFLPVRQITGMGTFAFLLFRFCMAMDPPRRARYQQVFAVEVHAELLNLLGGGIALLVWKFAGDGPLLTSAKIFTLWYVAALTAGLVRLFGFPVIKASLLASTAWIVSVLFNLFLLESVRTSMHLHL